MPYQNPQVSASAFPAQLPVVPPPIADELPLSWVGRIAAANDIPFIELLRHLGMSTKKLWRINVAPTQDQAARIAAATGRAPEQVAAMSISALDDHAQPYLAEKHDLKYCRRCVSAQDGKLLHTKVLPYPLLPLMLRHWRAAWAVRCQVCGTDLTSVHQLLWPNSEQPTIPEKHLVLAQKGARLLENAVLQNDIRALKRYHKALVLAHWAFGLPDPRKTVTSSSDTERVSALCAIARSESQPLRKVA